MFRFWYDMATLGFEAQQVIWPRSMRLAQGGKSGETEATRMVSEKMIAAADVAFAMGTGASPDKIVAQVRERVKANVRRLTAASY